MSSISLHSIPGRTHNRTLPVESFFYRPNSGPPNVGVQKSTGVSLVIGNVLEIGTKQSPWLLKSCFFPSDSFTLSQSFMQNIYTN